MGDLIKLRYCGRCRHPVNPTKPHVRRTVATPNGEMEVLFHLGCDRTKGAA